jgi:hypothetical protein
MILRSTIFMKSMLPAVFAALGLSLTGQTNLFPEAITAVPPIQQEVRTFRPSFRTMVQMWGLYTTDMEKYDASTGRYEAVDDRLNLLIRRARFVVSGTPWTRLKYTVVFHYDQIGRDILSGGVGGPNKADPNVGIWDAFFQYRLSGSDALHLTFGWFRPQVQRESITSGWTTTSFEKAMSQNYVRNHLVGTGPGRAMGVNLGGQVGHGSLHLLYNGGLFNPVSTAYAGASAGDTYAALLTGRLSLSIGDPEMPKGYGISYDINQFGRRKGLSLDWNLARQGETDLFRSSALYGPGVMLNYRRFNLDGEWMWMTREGERSVATGGPSFAFTSKSATGHIRASLNLRTGNNILEPVCMVMRFRGAMDATGQADATAVKDAYGEETTFDVGVNWYLNGQKVKVMVHYTWHDGEPGAAGDGSQANMFFSQSGVGAIHRGDWFGVGVNAVF